MYRRLAGLGESVVAANHLWLEKGSRTELSVEGGGVSRCLDGLHCMIHVSHKTGPKGQQQGPSFHKWQ